MPPPYRRHRSAPQRVALRLRCILATPAIILSLICGPAHSGDEPLNAVELNSAEVLALISTRPVWCIDRSNDGRSCASLMIANPTNERVVALSHFFRDDVSFPAAMIRNTLTLEFGPLGLCTDDKGWKGTLDWSHAEAGDQVSSFQASRADAPALEKMRAGRNSIGKLVTDQRQLVRGDPVCFGISRIGTGHQHYAMSVTWAAGTDHQSIEHPSDAVFEALSSDPGLLLR